MTLRNRLAKLETAQGGRPDPDAAAAFAALAERLDRMALALASGGAAAADARQELDRFLAGLSGGKE